MAHERLLEQKIQPNRDQVMRMIGREVLPVWEDVNQFLLENFSGYAPELVYYSPKEGWAYRWRKDAHQLCVLFPERGAFSALIVLTPEEDALALGKAHFFNARLRELLNQPSSLPQGRWLWMRLEDHTDYFGFKLLLELKGIVS